MASTKKTHEFGPFVLDSARGSLTRNGELLRLRPKSFQVLAFLLENPGRVVSKQEILDAVWADVAVTEDSLVQCLVDIRKTLGSEGQEFIRTVPKRGYLCELPGSEREPAGAARLGRTGWQWWIGWAAVLLVSASVWLAAVYGRTLVRETKSVLVLPFTPISGTDTKGSMSLGLADLLITRLGSLRGMIVRPMSAVARYSGGQVDPIEVGQKQRVELVLEGGLQEAAGEVRASVRLWSVEEGRVVWTKTFAEPVTKLLDLEDAISSRVAEAMELHLTTEESRRFGQRLTENPEAAALYARGLHHRDQGSRADVEKAEKLFKAAIEVDPGFARAYVGLADLYRDFSSPLPGDKREAEQQIRMLVQKALDLDGDLGDAHAAMAMVLHDAGDHAAAEVELRNASSLDPNSTYVVYANYKQSQTQGNVENALVYARRWCDLDPLSSRACEMQSSVLLAARRYDEAIAGFQQLLVSDPGFLPARTGLGTAYIGKQLYAKAIAEYESVIQVERAPERIRFCLLAFAYARSGKTAKARAMLEEMLRERERRSIRPQFFAVVYAGLGERDRAFELLDQAYPDRPGQPLVKIDNPSIDIALEVLRGDPRYYEFARRKGFSVR